ncbi:hypothetical protein DER45DRAFT_570235, partial [Fusarium avenaceum]
MFLSMLPFFYIKISLSSSLFLIITGNSKPMPPELGVFGKEGNTVLDFSPCTFILHLHAISPNALRLKLMVLFF